MCLLALVIKRLRESPTLCTMNHRLLVFLVLAVSASFCENSTNAKFTIRKCCPKGQIISAQGEDPCIEYHQYYHYSTDNVTNENNDAANTTASKFPWWMSEDTVILSADTRQPIEVDFSLQRVIYRACDWLGFSYVSENSSYRLLDDGSLLVSEEEERVYPPESFCMDRVDLTMHDLGTPDFVLLCPCDVMPCVRKCCPDGQVLPGSGERTACMDDVSVAHWRPKFFHGNADKATDPEYFLLHGPPKCNSGEIASVLNSRERHAVTDIRVMPDGSVVTVWKGVETLTPVDRYCADVSLFEHGRHLQNLLVCERRSMESKSKPVLYGAVTCVGALFLAATLLVYAVLPERRSMHAHELMAHCSSLLLGYVVLAAGQLHPATSHVWCVMEGFIIQFSFLAAFFWLNVICIDLCGTFSGFRPRNSGNNNRVSKKFRFYSFYAWGSTAAITLITALVEFSPESKEGDPDWLIRPGFGKSSCFFDDRDATLLYFYAPMALLLLANLVLFIVTAIKLAARWRETRTVAQSSTRHVSKIERRRILPYLNLFLLMGLTWVTEIISWAIGGDERFWYLPDFINLLRGIFVFVIFCCNRTVLKLLLAKLRRCRGMPEEDPDPSRRSSVVSMTSRLGRSSMTSRLGRSSMVSRLGRSNNGMPRKLVNVEETVAGKV